MKIIVFNNKIAGDILNRSMRRVINLVVWNCKSGTIHSYGTVIYSVNISEIVNFIVGNYSIWRNNRNKTSSVKNYCGSADVIYFTVFNHKTVSRRFNRVVSATANNKSIIVSGNNYVIIITALYYQSIKRIVVNLRIYNCIFAASDSNFHFRIVIRSVKIQKSAVGIYIILSDCIHFLYDIRVIISSADSADIRKSGRRT